MKHKYLLLVPIGLHLAVVISICLAGKSARWPGALDENGLAVSTDNQLFHPEVVSQAKTLTNEGILAFATTSSPFHVKLYALSFAILSPLFGNTILSAEPINLLFYLVILWLIFKLSRLICSRNTSLIAAGVIAVWPSFLLHTTQLFRDPLFIAAMLALIFICTSWLAETYRWRAALLRVAVGVASAAVIWLVRGGMKEVSIAVAALGGMLLLVKQIKERSFLPANTVGAVIVILACLSVPRIITPYHAPLLPKGDKPASSGEAPSLAEAADSVEERGNSTDIARTPVDSGAREETKIGQLRSRFVEQYPDAGSNIDAGVQLKSRTDIVRYLPRALAIGLFAPFPGMWFGEGKSTGAPGRILGGLETLLMYGFELMAVFGIWSMRHKWATWLLLLVVLTGSLSLGLVVVNVGALYRMRYVFWMLLIPLGAEGIMRARALWTARRRVESGELIVDS